MSRAPTNVVELHPEELIDLEGRGALDGAAVARLDAHCARCVACSYERALRAQFADVLGEHDAEMHDDAHDLELQERAATPRVSASSRRGIWGWAAPAAAMIGAAHLIAPEPERASATRSTHVAVDERNERARADTSAARARLVPKREPSKPCSTETAAMLFERANRARMRGEYMQALDVYRRLQRRYPSSLEARVSVVAMGRMQLDHGDGAGALASFERYEAWGNGDVDAVVMAGRALALDELGAETSSVAWADLLARHPESPYADHARLRVAARSM